MEYSHRLVGIAACLLELLVADLELLALLFSVGEGLGHANTRDTAFKGSVDGGNRFATALKGITHLCSGKQGHYNQKGHAGKNNKRQPQVYGGQVDEGYNDRYATDDDVLGAVMGKLAYIHQVVGQP